MIIKPCPICGKQPKFVDNVRFNFKGRKSVRLFGCPNGCRVLKEKDTGIIKAWVKFEGRKIDYDFIFKKWNEELIYDSN